MAYTETPSGAESSYQRSSDREWVAAAVYEEYCAERRPFLDRFAECAKLSDRTAYVWPETSPIEAMVQANQSDGARGVDFLKAALMLTMLPPNVQAVRIEADPVLAKLYDDVTKGKVTLDSQLSIYSQKIADEVDAIHLRGPTEIAVRDLLIGGNAGFFLYKKGLPRHIPLSRYVQKRDSYGRLLRMIICEQVEERFLSERAKKALQSPSARPTSSLYVYSGSVLYEPTNPKTKDKKYEIYTCVEARQGKDEFDDLTYDVWQEIAGVVIEGSFGGPYDEHNCPFMSWGYEWVGSENYAHSRVERYSGGLNSTEGLTQIVLEGAAAISKIVLGVDPGGLISPDELADAKNGDIVPARVTNGVVQDVGAIQTHKTLDLGFAKALRDTLSQETSRDFGYIYQARDKDRVTAEETSVLAQQLERGLGGIYSHFSRTIQLPLFERVIYRLEERNEAPIIPMRRKDRDKKQILHVRVITGLEALGRGNDAQRILGVIQSLAQMASIPQQVMQQLDVKTIIKKICLSQGVNPEEFTLTDEQVAALMEQARQQQNIEALGPNIVNQVGQAAIAAQNPPSQSAA